MATEQEQLKDVLEEFFSHLPFSPTYEISKKEKDDGVLFHCKIYVQEGSKILIGHNGLNLQALEHMIRLLVGRKLGRDYRLVVDVNDYLHQKNRKIAMQAQHAAQDVARTRRPVILPPMSGRERRIVHLILADNDRIETESIGTGDERKVVIKPKNDLS